MSDPIDVTVETDEETTTARVHDDEAELESGDTTVRFCVDGADTASNDAKHSAADTDRTIAPLSAVPEDSTVRFEARSGDRGVSCFLHRNGEEVTAWRNSCPHKPHVPIDPGSGAIVSGDELVCHEHGARFEEDSGVCTAGPCAGDRLDPVEVAVEDGTVVLTDDRFDVAERY
ncbi:Rieske 2Fe-2S domain-containing protein [Halapricum sp. CBA1109]|uniref:Rieske (2Fe-2S) protein n=1 Tax=Halapricum sp. CBA1109 TaxID=2668068 RepID=UPI0012F7802D|nr:Rieske 2Fe-2S domain-containing protein [Halapricum sp. CBA1109]MUV90229.1 Rieske 2Fe-2S domain-containing protein [Halapricum sp. CBA1109]